MSHRKNPIPTPVREALSAAVFLGPLVLIIGLGFFIAGNVEDGREVRRQAKARDAILNTDDC